MFKTKKFWYISLFAILYLIVAFSSFYHACAFFELANNSWMAIILAFAFEIGQAAVLFSLLTSKKDRNRVMPWVLMTMFTLVQVIGNVFSSYKYLSLNSVADLKYFKEPIFIWTQLPDDITTVIVTYIIGAILPITALLLTSMITNYLSDEEELSKENITKETEIDKIDNEIGPKEPIILNSEDRDKVYKEDVKEDVNEEINEDINKEIKEDVKEEIEEKPIENTEEIIEEEQKPEKTSHFINLK